MLDSSGKQPPWYVPTVCPPPKPLILNKKITFALACLITVALFPVSVIADPYTPTIKRSWPTVLSTTIIVQESIAFDVACADTDGNLVRVDWYIDGDFSHSSTVTSYCDQASWKKRFSSEGVYNIWAIAVNSDGNTDETAWKISVEGAPVRRHMPTIKRTLPPVYASIVSVDKKMNFGVECINADGNLSRVDWYVDDAFSHSSRVSGDYNLAGWNKGFSSEGVHKIRAVIIDLNGNTDETAWKIKVAPLKEHDPHVFPKTPDSPVNLAVQDQMTFEVDAIDPDGDLRGLEWQYRIGDGEWQDADDRNRLSGDRGRAAHTHTFTSEGMWHIKATVHDCRDAVASCTWFVSVKTSANRPPSTLVTEISGQPAIMCSDVQYAITANYYDPDGADDLHYCYLCLDHPNVSDLIMMWDHNTGDYSVWAGDSGDDYLTLEDVQVSLISGSPEGYRLTWKFIINQDWPEVNTGIRFGVYAEDDGRLAHGWKYGNPDTGFTNRFWWSKFSNSVVLHTKKGDPQTNGVIEFSTKGIDSVAKDAFLQFGLNIGTRTADSVGRFIQSVGSWGNKTPGTILKSYASSESSPEFSDELYLVMGEEFIPIMTYNIGDETGWYYGFEIIVYRKEGGYLDPSRDGFSRYS